MIRDPEHVGSEERGEHEYKAHAYREESYAGHVGHRSFPAGSFTGGRSRQKVEDVIGHVARKIPMVRLDRTRLCRLRPGA